MSAKKFSIVCYNEELLVNYLEENKDKITEWAYIKHQPETDEKKEHFHLFLEFETPKNASPIAKALDINIMLVSSCRNKYSLLRYFLHLSFPNKIRYEIEDIVSNIDIHILRSILILNIETPEDFLFDIIEYIKNGFSMKEIVHICIQNRTINELRRYWQIIKFYYDENKFI